jgi:uncharacterized protein
MRMHPDAEAVVRALNLAPHPEGGFYRETFRSITKLDRLPHPGGKRAASTAIYYLLPSGAFSALHCVASDEVWHHYDGDPLELHTIDRTGLHAVVILGSRVTAGQRPQHVVPAGVWQAAVPLGDRYSLCGCTVAPGFDFLDFEMPPRRVLLEQFPLIKSVVEKLTRDEPPDTIKMRV